MEKTIYLIRHCQATGQAPDAELTELGKVQAKELALFLQDFHLTHFVSSPFTRAIQTIEPAADQQNMPIEIDERLAERILSSENLPDWLEKLEASFLDDQLTFPGGESGQEAGDRAMAAIAGLEDRSVVVTHGNLLGLVLTRLNKNYGFSEWQKLSNPDVYEVKWTENEKIVTRLWN